MKRLTPVEMHVLRRYVIAALLAATLNGVALNVNGQVGAPASPAHACEVPVVRPNSDTPRVTGPEEITSRVRILRQPDSPISVLAVDFSRARLTLAPGYFDWLGPYTLEIANASDRSLRDIRAVVHVRSENLSGVGSGVRLEQVLAPGARMLLAGMGNGRGTFHGEDVTIDVVVESVRWEGCEYRPSQTIPLADERAGRPR